MCSFTSRRWSARASATLDEGMRVSFETEPDKRGKGPKAVNLQQA